MALRAEHEHALAGLAWRSDQHVMAAHNDHQFNHPLMTLAYLITLEWPVIDPDSQMPFSEVRRQTVIGELEVQLGSDRVDLYNTVMSAAMDQMNIPKHAWGDVRVLALVAGPEKVGAWG